MDSEPHGQSSSQSEHVWVLALVLPRLACGPQAIALLLISRLSFLICKSRAMAVLASSHVERF